MSQASPWLGVIADDVAAAVGLAGEVTAAGLSAVVVLRRPDDRLPDVPSPQNDCTVVALTTRTAPRGDHPRAVTEPTSVPEPGPGPCLIISGSCSERTREQVAAHAGPRLRISAPELAADAAGTVDRAVRAVVEAWEASSIPLVYSTADAERVRAEQEEVGRDRAARLVEHALGEVARRAVHDHGARRLIVAGGETSGAVTSALGVDTLHVGHRVEAGLPWTVTAGEPHLALLLKSGNFGRPGLFAAAWETCP